MLTIQLIASFKSVHVRWRRLHQRLNGGDLIRTTCCITSRRNSSTKAVWTKHLGGKAWEFWSPLVGGIIWNTWSFTDCRCAYAAARRACCSSASRAAAARCKYGVAFLMCSCPNSNLFFISIPRRFSRGILFESETDRKKYNLWGMFSSLYFALYFLSHRSERVCQSERDRQI